MGIHRFVFEVVEHLVGPLCRGEYLLGGCEGDQRGGNDTVVSDKMPVEIGEPQETLQLFPGILETLQLFPGI